MDNNIIRQEMLQRAKDRQNALLKKSNEETVEDTITTEQQKEKDNSNILVSSAETVADVSVSVAEGLVSSLEGIVDILAGLVGEVGGIFSEDFKEGIRDFTETDYSSQWLGQGAEWRQDLSEKSYLEYDGIVNQIANGVGGMLPSILVTLATGGTAAPALAAKVLQTGTFIAGAAGQAMEQAQVEGADTDASFGYGLLSGAIEGATEYIGGRAIGEVTGMSNTLLGKTLLKTGAGQKIMNNGLGKIGYKIVSEGMEEVLSDLADPIARSVTGIQGWDETFSKESVQDVISGLPKTFIVGGLTAVVLDAGQQTFSNITNNSKGGKHYNTIAEELMQMDSVIQFNEMTKESESKSVTQEKKDKTETMTNQFVKTKLENIANELSAMTEEQRKNALENDFADGLKVFFNADGTVNADVTEALEKQIASGKASNTSDTIFNERKENEYFASQDKLLQRDKSGNVQTDENGNAKSFVQVSTKALTEEESQNQATLLRAVRNVAGNSFTANRVVVIKSDNASVNGWTNGNTIYINENLLKQNGGWDTTVLHEISHNLEGTLAHGSFAHSLLKDEDVFNKAVEETAKGYVEGKKGDDAIQDVKNAYDKWERGEKLNATENLYLTELSAKSFGNMSSEDIMRELGRNKKGLTNKLRNLWNDVINQRYTPENREKLAEAKKTARRLEKLFESVGEELSTPKQESKSGYTVNTKNLDFGATEEQKRNREQLKRDLPKTIGNRKDIISRIKQSGVAPLQMNIETFENPVILTKDGMQSTRQILESNLKSAGFDKIMTDRIINQVQGAVDSIKKLKADYKVLEDFASIKPYYREDGSLMLTCVIKNGEYEMNVDFTTICKKREALAKFLTEYQESGHTFGKDGFSKTQQAYLENLLRKYDIDSACSFCFVEARRRNVDTWGKKWQDLWYKALAQEGLAKTVKSINSVEAIKNIDVINGITERLSDENVRGVVDVVEGDINSDVYAAYMETERNGKKPDTFALMLDYIQKHKNDGQIYRISSEDLLNVRTITYMRAMLPDLYSIAIRSYGSNAPKMTLPASPYASDVFLSKTFLKKNVISRAFEIGGVRINSFSDFQISRVIDYIQFVADCQAKGVPIQTYTKELVMCEILGKCGIKGNLSLIPEVDASVDKQHAGLDKNGNYIMSRDSVAFKKSVELQEREGIKGDWGTCLVGIGKYQIVKALNDDRIKMIIPYHASGMPKHLKIYFNHTLYNDYTSVQNTRAKKDGKWKKMDTDVFTKVWYGSYRENNGDYIKATNDYIAYCRENQLLPRFFFGDLSVKPGESFQDAFDRALQDTDKQYIVTNPNYYKVLIDFTSDGGVDKNGNRIFKQQKAVSLELPDTKTFESIVKRECVALQEQIDLYESKKGLMFRALQDAVNGKNLNLAEQQLVRNARIQEDNERYTVKDDLQLDRTSTDEIQFNRDSEGNELTEQQQSFFKDSKVRDENGNLLKVYHGTPKGNFTVFNPKLSLFADNPSIANWFSTNVDMINKYYNVKRRGSESENKLFTVYLNSKNPLVIDAHGDAWNQIKVPDDVRDGVNFVLRNPITDETWVSDELDTERIAKYAAKNGYDGVILKNVRDGSTKDEPSDVYAVFNSNQIKSVDNKNPTPSDDIRFDKSVDLSSSGEQLTDAENTFIEHFKNDWLVPKPHWTTQSFIDTVFNTPSNKEFDFIQRMYDGDEKAKDDLVSFVRKLDDVAFLEKYSRYNVGTYKDKDRIPHIKNGRLVHDFPYKKAVNDFNKIVDNRIQTIASELGSGENLNIKKHVSSLQEVKSLFDKLNNNNENAQLFEKVYNVCKDLNIRIQFTGDMLSRDASGLNYGRYTRYYTTYFNDATVSNQKKANTLLHELIHGVTTYAFEDVNKYGYESKYSGFVSTINDIYNDIKYDHTFYNFYGRSSAQEMLAELGNESFAEKLRQKSLLERIVDAILRLFGVKKTNAYDGLRYTLEDLLTNTNTRDVESYYERQDNAIQNNASYGYKDIRFDKTSTDEADDSNVFHKNFGDRMREISTATSSDQEKMAQYIHSVSTIADEIRAMTDKKYAKDHGYKVPATLLNDNQFKTLVNKASKIFFGGQISPAKVRNNIIELSTALSENSLFEDFIRDMNKEREGVGDALLERLEESFRVIYKEYEKNDNRSALTLNEWEATDRIFRVLKKFYENFDFLYEDGKRLELTEEVKKYIEIAKRVKPMAVKGVNAMADIYLETTMMPKAVVERFDGYDKNGFFTHFVERFTKDSYKQQVNYIRLMTDVDEWMAKKENKKYAKRLTEERIAYNGDGSTKILVGEAIDIYLQAIQHNGLLTLCGKNGAGFNYTKEDGTVSQVPLKYTQPGEKDNASLSKQGKEELRALYNSFSEQDKEFIKLVMELYKEGGNLKGETDLKMYGFTDVVGYGDENAKTNYYQLTRDKRVFARSDGDAQSKAKDVLNVGNLKINKKRSKNAHTVPLLATNVYSKMVEYVRQTTLYNAFAEDTNNYNRIKKKELATNTEAKGQNLNMAYSSVTERAFKYMDKLMNDIQGVSPSKTEIGKALAWIRSNYAQAQLGLNIKVVLSQMASYPTALMHLDAGILSKAVFMKRNYSDMDKYCDSAKVRAYEKTVVKSQTLTDKVSKVGKVTGAGIQATDRLTIGTLWAACQLQVEKDNKLKFGTEENKVKAGELLNQVIGDTQPTYTAAQRSALQRSDNEVLKSIAMFTSVPLKQMTMVVSSLEKVNYIKRSIKYGSTQFTKEDLKKARNTFVRNSAAVTLANIMYAAICQGVKFILDQDDEEDNDGKNALEQFLTQFMDTTFGMFPFVKELESFIVHGYDVSEVSTSTVNNFLNDIKNTVSLGEKVVNGTATSQDVAKTSRQLVYDLGMLFGVPIRNLYNLTYGLTKRISETTAYNINSVFYAPTVSDINTAISKNDKSLALASTSGVMAYRGFDVSNEQSEIFLYSVKNGGTLPSATPTKITVNGVEQTLSANERNEFDTIYSNASEVVNECIEKKLFSGLTSDEQVEVANTIYKYYYDMAKYEALGLDATKLYLVGQAFNIGTFAKIITKCKSFTGNDRKAQITKYINSQNLTAAQKYILMGYLGYKNTKGESKVKSYIKSLDLTKDEKELLLSYSGY